MEMDPIALSDKGEVQKKDEIVVEYNCIECSAIFTFESEFRKHLESHNYK